MMLTVSGLQEPVELVDNEDGTYTAKYTPTKEGTHHIQVKYADEDVPHSPYRVRVQPKHDASKVRVVVVLTVVVLTFALAVTIDFLLGKVQRSRDL